MQRELSKLIFDDRGCTAAAAAQLSDDAFVFKTTKNRFHFDRLEMNNLRIKLTKSVTQVASDRVVRDATACDNTDT
jgi:hypothetical protein